MYTSSKADKIAYIKWGNVCVWVFLETGNVFAVNFPK